MVINCVCGEKLGNQNTTKVASSPLSNVRTTTTDPISFQSIAAGNVDKRVALTVAPKTYQRDETLYAEKILRVLGEIKSRPEINLNPSAYFYGLLRNALGTSSGLIFPYTPTISFSHQTNYNPVDILHSNIAYQYYKNSPPPSISLSAKFTADNRDNALHMLSAIWFLVACSKCEFGEKSKYAGLPPPVLYLNGYDHLIDNIPVVITSVKYTYMDNKHYVNLVLDFSKKYEHRGEEWIGGDTTFNDSGFCRIYTSTSGTVTEKQNKVFEIKKGENETQYIGADYITDSAYSDPEVTDINEVWKTINGTESANYKSDNIAYSFWLPTDIQIDIGLAVQPNLLKVRKQWTLDDYKSGVLLTNDGKNPEVWAPDLITNDKLLSAKKLIYDGEMTGKDGLEKCGINGDYISFIPSGWTW